MPVKIVECQCCHFTRRYEAESWDLLCGQVANDFLWPLCKRCFGEYEKGLTEAANTLRRTDGQIRELVGGWM